MLDLANKISTFFIGGVKIIQLQLETNDSIR